MIISGVRSYEFEQAFCQFRDFVTFLDLVHTDSILVKNTTFFFFLECFAFFFLGMIAAFFCLQVNLQLLATCYLQNNQAYAAYNILKGMCWTVLHAFYLLVKFEIYCHNFFTHFWRLFTALFLIYGFVLFLVFIIV